MSTQTRTACRIRRHRAGWQSPGESAVIEYTYSVADTTWGHWFQRAVRLPTKRLSVELESPTEWEPSVWGAETTMTASAIALRTAFTRSQKDGRSLFAWSTEDPPLHARYRLEWSFRGRRDEKRADVDEARAPSQVMAELGVVQEGDPILSRPGRPFDLPAERAEAERVLDELRTAMVRISAVHQFSKGMGVSASQIGIDRAAAIIHLPEGDELVPLSPSCC